jgi:hypothetical protein
VNAIVHRQPRRYAAVGETRDPDAFGVDVGVIREQPECRVGIGHEIELGHRGRCQHVVRLFRHAAWEVVVDDEGGDAPIGQHAPILEVARSDPATAV